MNTTVTTVLGQVDASELGVVAVHEALLSVIPGAQYAYDITIDRAALFDTLRAHLEAFRAAGGGTLVDRGGMYHGRDVRLYEHLSRVTGVHIIASTGMGPEAKLGGYFLTPQTNPPTPWPAERFEALFAAEVEEGMVVPRVERRGGAGIVMTDATASGATPTDLSLLRGAARAAARTGVALSFGAPADPVTALEIALAEGLPAGRIIVAGLDRTDAAAALRGVLDRGAFVAIDHVGTEGGAGLLDDDARADLVVDLIDAGYCDRILLSSSSTGAAFGHAPANGPLTAVLTDFAPRLRARGVSEQDLERILVHNPRIVLTGQEN
ncbi:phosphotriesterase family protein [Microbacterium sp. GXF7504]